MKKQDLSIPVPASSFRCSCGCDLQLTRGDFLDAARCLQIAGSERHHVNLRQPSSPESSRTFAKEPMKSVRCSRCYHGIVEMPVYLFDFLSKVGAGKQPLQCDECRNPKDEA
jgi:hypothetical protein